MIQRVGAELHGARDDGLGGDGVEDPLVLEDDEARHVRDDVALLKLLQVEDLDVWKPYGLHKVGGAHHTLWPPIGGVGVHDESSLLPREVEVQLERHRQRDVVNLGHLLGGRRGRQREFIVSYPSVTYYYYYYALGPLPQGG